MAQEESVLADKSKLSESDVQQQPLVDMKGELLFWCICCNVIYVFHRKVTFIPLNIYLLVHIFVELVSV